MWFFLFFVQKKTTMAELWDEIMFVDILICSFLYCLVQDDYNG